MRGGYASADSGTGVGDFSAPPGWFAVKTFAEEYAYDALDRVVAVKRKRKPGSTTLPAEFVRTFV